MIFPGGVSPPAKGDHYVKVASSQTFPLENGKRYAAKLVIREGEQEVESPVSEAIPEPNWFNLAQANNLIFVVAFTGVLLASIRAARRNPHVYLRRIAGLDAVEEAIGRSTEMGRPILYLTGAGDMGELPTIAATVILGEVAKKVAHYDTTLKVPHRDPIVMAVCQEVVKEAYVAAGRPDAYREDSNFFITSDQFSYTAAVDGIMLREKPAANFFMGSYFAESLLAHRDRRQHRRDPDRRDRFRPSASVLRDHLRLHPDRRGAVRGQRLFVARAGAGRDVAWPGFREGAHHGGAGVGHGIRDLGRDRAD